MIAALTALLLVAGLAGLFLARQEAAPFDFELEWMDEILEHRSALWTAPALVFNLLGGGFVAIAVVPLTVAVLFVLWRRPWAALYFGLASAVSAAIVQVVKNLVGRPRPTDMLVSPDFGSFPSGHSANAAVIATALGILFARAWVWAAGAVYTAGMMLSRTYLGAHWITDTFGGLLVGAAVAVLVWALLAWQLDCEKRAGAPPVWRPV